MAPSSIFWFRRDLRITDNAGLYHALKNEQNVLPIFIFDTHILNKLGDRQDARVSFIHREITRLHTELAELGTTINVFYGKPEDVWQAILHEYPVASVYTNHDYEPYATKRDQKVHQILEAAGIPFHTFKDHVIFEKSEVVKKDGTPYTVFTPYSKKWREKLSEKIWGGTSFYLTAYPVEQYTDHLFKTEPSKLPSLDDIGFKPTTIDFPDRTVPQKLIKNYNQTRNFTALDGTSKLGVHFRFGTISIRDKARKAAHLNETFLNELIWRDFYAMILWHFPHVVDGPFREKYAGINWRNNEAEFQAWCDGKTGYPIVDAGMRELNATGYMHNRVRMITASFLTKHLLVNWQWGEAYFAEKLLDFDLASNNGGWQWAAGTGTDAAPYFRIFNPYTQAEKFDKNRQYIKQWIPEFGTPDYVAAIVEHKAARQRCLERYKEGLG